MSEYKDAGTVSFKRDRGEQTDVQAEAYSKTLS